MCRLYISLKLNKNDAKLGIPNEVMIYFTFLLS